MNVRLTVAILYVYRSEFLKMSERKLIHCFMFIEELNKLIYYYFDSIYFIYIMKFHRPDRARSQGGTGSK